MSFENRRLPRFFLSVLFLGALWGTTASATGAPPPPNPSKYAHLDPKHEVPREALNEAVAYYDSHLGQIANRRFLTVIDFTKHSGLPRFFVIDMNSGAVDSYHTAHGSGSDPDHNGYADRFSNTDNSHMSSLGFYLTGSTYQGENGLSLYLDGLSATNSNARARAIVVHGAAYVDPDLPKMGRSWGCPALSPDVTAHVIGQIKGKSLLYAWRD